MSVEVAVAVASLDPTVHREVALVKSALLYADKVILYSPVALLLDEVAELAELPSKQKLTVMAELAPYVGHADKAAALQQMIDQFSRSDLDDRNSALLKMQLDKAFEPMVEAMNSMLETSGMHELVVAYQAGLVDVHPLIPQQGLPSTNRDQIIDSFLEQLAEVIVTGHAHPIFDDAAKGLVRAMVEEGVAQPSDVQVRRGKQAATGTGLIEQLPSFATATMLEVIDIRQDLDAPLARYRGAVAQISSGFDSEPYSSDLQAEIDDAWRDLVRPELMDLQERIAENSYLSNLLDSALSPSAVGAAILTLGSVAVADLPSALALAGLSVPAMRGALQKYRETRELNRHRFYLLHEVEAKTAKTGP